MNCCHLSKPKVASETRANYPWTIFAWPNRVHRNRVAEAPSKASE